MLGNRQMGQVDCAGGEYRCGSKGLLLSLAIKTTRDSIIKEEAGRFTRRKNREAIWIMVQAITQIIRENMFRVECR